MAISKVVYGNDTLIDLTADTVTSDSLANGYTAHDKSGTLINGALKYITYYSGSSDPSSSVGSDGDLYFKI